MKTKTTKKTRADRKADAAFAKMDKLAAKLLGKMSNGATAGAWMEIVKHHKDQAEACDAFKTMVEKNGGKKALVSLGEKKMMHQIFAALAIRQAYKFRLLYQQEK